MLGGAEFATVYEKAVRKKGGNEILVGKKERDGNDGYNGSRNIQPSTSGGRLLN